MRILIDALGINVAGGGRTSILNLMQEVFKQDSQNDYSVLLTQHETSLDLFSEKVKQLVIPVHNRFIVRIISQIILIFNKKKYDLIHYTKNLGFFGLNKPSIVTIHDLTTILYPNLVPKIDLLYWKTIQRVTTKNAKLIIAVSNNAAEDIVKSFKIPREKVRVVSHGISTNFVPIPKNEIQKIREKYNLPELYFLHVGRIDKKKNLTLLVEAFATLIIDHNFPGKLVLVGQEYKKSPDEKLHRTIQRLGINDKVMFTGYVPDADLPAIYSGAISCVFPSIHEGFGLFAVEAMACGVPIIVNKGGALEETVQKAGIVLDICTIKTLSKSMYEIYKNASLRSSLVELGFVRAATFSWSLAAKKMISIYEEVGGNN